MSIADFEDLNWASLLKKALREDHFEGDQTTRLCSKFLIEKCAFDESEEVSFALVSREDGVFCGSKLLEHLIHIHRWRVDHMLEDGDAVLMGTKIFEGTAPVMTLLSLERSVLNILQHLSGIASHTKKFKDLIDEAWMAWSREEQDRFPKPKLYHTRKTLPGLRPYQVYAACVGGADRHRLHLSDRVMLKDNHKFLLAQKKASFVELVNWAREGGDPYWPLWLVEVDTPAEALHMNAIGIKHILLDNFPPQIVREIVPTLKNVDSIEISGGLRLENLKNYVIPGVHRLSVGALTHSARSLDISLELSAPHAKEFVPDERGFL
jgi:nicotinate-nucleotide pyrophosphorylase (carboxylating)